MHKSPPCCLSPVLVAVKLLAVAPLLLVAQQAVATELIQYNTTIDGTKPPTDYLVNNGATLTANGANTRQIEVQVGSGLSLNGSSVAGTGSGIRLVNASATITGSNVSGTSTGLEIGRASSNPGGSTAAVRDSVISGGVIGVVVGSLGRLTAANTQFSGKTIGMQLANGVASIQGGSITGGNGVFINPGDFLTQPNTLTLDGTTVRGTTGSAILVGDFGLPSTAAQISVNNGSTLTGANGVLLEVTSGATANMTVDNSRLAGDVTAEQGSTVNLVLQNSAILTGNLQNVASLGIDSNAQWVMVGDGQVANLAMNGGSVKFGQPGDFFKLSVGNLSGNGTFAMEANFAKGQADFLDVTGTATGSHQLAVTASGEDPMKNTSLHLVHIAGGDADFTLRGGPVDLGTYSYDLSHQGNDWYLDAASKTISPGTQSVLALFDAAPSVWYGELTSLRTRMGELRMDGGNAGGWMRAYGNQYNVSASSGVAYQQNQHGLSLGADAPLPMGGGQWLVGVMAGYSKSDLDLDRGTSGTVDSYYAGAYTTWLDEPSGYYFDGVLKFNRFQNTSKVSLSDGQQAKGKYDTNGVGVSLEFGRHIKLDDDYFVEPFGQLASLVVQGKDYNLDNGMSAQGDRARSLLGKLGATAGRNFNLGEGRVIQPYVRAALVHEFVNNNEVKVNDNAFNNDLSGSRGELGAGVAMSLNEKWQVHADFDYSNGDKIEQPWGANVGLRYSW